MDRAERLLLVGEQPIEGAPVDAREAGDLRDRGCGVAMFLHDLGGREHDPLPVVFGDLLLREPGAPGAERRRRAQRGGRQIRRARRRGRRLELSPPVLAGGLSVALDPHEQVGLDVAERAFAASQPGGEHPLNGA